MSQRLGHVVCELKYSEPDSRAILIGSRTLEMWEMESEDLKGGGVAYPAVGMKIILKRTFPVHGVGNSVTHVRWGKPSGLAMARNL